MSTRAGLWLGILIVIGVFFLGVFGIPWLIYYFGVRKTLKEDIIEDLVYEYEVWDKPLVPLNSTEKTIDFKDSKWITYTTKCPICFRDNKITVPTPVYAAWVDGAKIQDAWPEAEDWEREVVISGCHRECFDEIFGDDSESGE